MSYSATIDVTCFVGNELYAHLTKHVGLPFAPTNGLTIAFKLRPMQEEVDIRNYRALVGACNNSTGMIVIESVIYFPDGDAERKSFYVHGMPATGKSEAEIAAYAKLMQDYYGFTLELAQ
jgi:hypothetical protein